MRIGKATAVGAPVTLRGVKIGTVRSMKVYLKLPDLVPVIPVYTEIEPNQVSWTKDPLAAGASDLAIAVKAGLRAQLATQSLVTGQVSVNLDFHPETSATLVGSADDAVEIPSDCQHIKDEIADLGLPDLAERARAALSAINQVVGERNGKLGPLADSVKQTSGDARVTLDTVTHAVRQLQAAASRTLNSVDHLATSTEGEIHAFGQSAGEVVTRAGKVMDNLNGLTAAERS
jgi:paraquat-inducible protein B